MALVESVDLPLGSKMPDFELPDPFGKLYKSAELAGEKGLLIVFTCNHCPYAKALWKRFIRLAGYAGEVGINTVAVNPNIHPEYPEDSAEMMKKNIEVLKIDFPYMIDESQEIARQFFAQCTPDIYLYDADSRLVYHGRFDDNWQDEKAVTKEELKEAIENLSRGELVSPYQFPSMGCSIKWK